MTALPAVSEFTGSTVTEAQFKTAITNLRSYLSGLLGDDGTLATALDTLGGLGGATAVKAAAYTVLTSDKGVVFLCSGTWTLSLTAAATLGSKFSFAVINTGAGVVTLDPNAAELISGAATKPLGPGESCIVTCDGTALYVISGGGGNADTVDGFHASQSVGANSVAVRDASGNLPGNVLGSSGSCTGNAATATTATTVSAAAISQSKLKSTSGAVSTVAAAADLTLPGGLFGFYPQVQSLGSVSAFIRDIGGIVTSYRTNITLKSDTTNPAYAQQQYIQSSPPYNLGDGDIPLFCFALVDKNGTVRAMYTAPEAPWHNNGPTSIKPDIYTEDGRRFKRVRKNLSPEMLLQNPRLEPHRMQEITQEIKQADMGLIPHPFMGNDLAGLTVVLIDPVSDHTWRAAELFGDDNHSEHHDLYYKNKLIIDNAPLNRKGPQGVQIAGVRWKNSK